MLERWEGRAPAEWARAWDVPVVEAWPVLGSTNDRARALAEAGTAAFTVVIAEEQTAGRGREGRRWESPRGAGLWMSLALPGERRPTPVLPLLAGLATCRAVEGAAPGVAAGVKWPNDVMVAGRKVAGILCEAGSGGVVVGIGVNVRAAAFPAEVAGRAGSLEELAGAPVDRAALAGRLIGELRGLLAGDGGGLHREQAAELARRDLLRDREVVTAAAGRGVARGIGADGGLRLEVAPGDMRRVSAGGVRLVED